MAEAKKMKQLMVKTDNRVGMLAEITGAITDSGCNISAISAYVIEDIAYFRLITDDNQKAGDTLKAKGYEVTDEEVVSLTLEDRPGAAKEIADKLKTANIDLKYIYGTTCLEPSSCKLIFDSNDNDKAIEVINS